MIRVYCIHVLIARLGIKPSQLLLLLLLRCTSISFYKTHTCTSTNHSPVHRPRRQPVPQVVVRVRGVCPSIVCTPAPPAPSSLPKSSTSTPTSPTPAPSPPSSLHPGIQELSVSPLRRPHARGSAQHFPLPPHPSASSPSSSSPSGGAVGAAGRRIWKRRLAPPVRRRPSDACSTAQQ